MPDQNDDVARFKAIGAQAAPATINNNSNDPDVSRFMAVGQQQQDTPPQTPPVQPQKSIENQVGDVFNDIGTGMGQATGQTVHGVGELIRKGGNLIHPGLGDKVIPPEGQRALDSVNHPQNFSQSAGNVIEDIAQFSLGDSALKAASVGEKLLHVSKVADAYEKAGPLARRAIEYALNAVRTGAVTGGMTEVQTGGDHKQALENAALGAGASVAAEAGGDLIKAGARKLGIGGKQAVQAIMEDAPNTAEAGTVAKKAAEGVKQDAGQAVAAAKEAIPEGFTMRVGPGTGLHDTLATIEKEIGGEASGLDSLKDPSLNMVRDVVTELSSGEKSLSVPEINAIKQQLNSQISRAEVAARNGHATGDTARYLKQVKGAFDSEFLGQLSNEAGPAAAYDLQTANKGFATVAQNQAKGPAKGIFKADTPEKIVARLSNADATTIKSFTSGMSEAELTPVRDGSFRRAIERSVKDGKPQFQQVLDQFDRNEAAMRELYGPKFEGYRQALKTAAQAQKTDKALKYGALTLGGGALTVAGGGYGWHVIKEFLK